MADAGVARASQHRSVAVTAGAVMLAAAAGLAAIVTLPAPTAGAATSFAAAASAEGLRVSVFAGGAPVSDIPADGGSPVVQAELDSLGTSRAFGSVAYPGDTVVSLPGLTAGVSQGKVTPPAYPLIASSDATTAPKQEVSVPGVSMTASSEATRSIGTAIVGATGEARSVPHVVASAATRNNGDGTVTASSKSVVSALTSDVVKLGELRSAATVTLGADGTVQRSSSFTVSGLEIGGIKVGVGPEGLSFGGGATPLPSSNEARAALAQAGIAVTLLDAIETADGVVGQGLEISVTRETGAAVTPVSLRLRFGRAAARVGQAAGSLVTDAPLPPLETTPVPGTRDVPASPPAAVVEPPAADGISATSGHPAPFGSADASDDSIAAPAVGAGPPTGEPPVATTDTAHQPPTALAQTAAAQRFDTRHLYPVVAGLALLAGAGVFLIAHFGVRTP